MFRNLKIRTKILLAFCGIAILAVGVTGFVAFSISRAALEAESFNKLTAVREMKSSQIEDYFLQIRNQVISLSKDRMAIDAMQAFDRGFSELADDLDWDDARLMQADDDLVGYYQQEFLPRLIPNLAEEVVISDYLPKDETTRLLQSLYITDNPFDTGSKQHHNTSGDESSYSRTHELYHPIMRDYLERFGFYDIFLVNNDGDVVYTVFKEVDYGTSLEDGPYSNTNFAEAYRVARDSISQGKDFVYLVDYESYHPSYNAPAAFMASPIWDGDKRLGVLLFQMPVDRINDIMTNREAWSEVGLGESGETYLVGDDFRLRNQSRFLIEDSENYLRMIEQSGLEPNVVEQIRSLGSSIGLQEVKTQGTEAALRGETDTQVFPDYRGEPVLSAYGPLAIPGVDWVIMSEIDAREAFSPIRSLRNQLILVAAALISAIVAASIFFARSLTGPLRDLTARASDLADGDLDVTVDVRGKDEIADLARSFVVMQGSIRDLIRRQNEAIDALSAPLIPLTSEIVVMPLIGELDERRLNDVSETLTEGLYGSTATVAILDITGVPRLDEEAAEHLLRTARKASLLGAKVIVTGLRPQIAAELVELDLHFADIVTERSLQSGVSFALDYLRRDGAGTGVKKDIDSHVRK